MCCRFGLAKRQEELQIILSQFKIPNRLELGFNVWWDQTYDCS